jgi:hypothetical protein
MKFLLVGVNMTNIVELWTLSSLFNESFSLDTLAPQRPVLPGLIPDILSHILFIFTGLSKVPGGHEIFIVGGVKLSSK